MPNPPGIISIQSQTEHTHNHAHLRTFHAKNMTNKSPRLPRKAFTLPGPPAPPNSPALLLPAPPKQDSFALRVVEGIEDAALVEIKCDAPAQRPPSTLWSSSTSPARCRPSAKYRTRPPKRRSTASRSSTSASTRRGRSPRRSTPTRDSVLITFDNVAELVLPSASVDKDHVTFRRRNQSRRARLLTANPTILSFLKKIVQPVSAPLRLDGACASPVAVRAGQTAPHGPRRPRPPGVHEPLGRPRISIRRAS